MPPISVTMCTTCGLALPWAFFVNLTPNGFWNILFRHNNDRQYIYNHANDRIDNAIKGYFRQLGFDFHLCPTSELPATNQWSENSNQHYRTDADEENDK